MKVISISTDRKIFEAGSAVRARMIEYGSLFDELHIIVFTNRSDAFQKIQIAERVWVYTTNSVVRLFCIFNAIRIGSGILKKTARGEFVVTCQDPFETGLAGWRIAKKFSLKLQLQIHTDLFSPHFLEHSTLNRIRVHIARFLLPKADGIRAVSQRIADSLVTKKLALKTAPAVLPVLVDIRKIKMNVQKTDIRAAYPQFDTVILMLSRLEPEKDISSALKAFRLVVEKNRKTGLLIVGEGGEKTKLKQEAKTLGLEDQVVFEPWTKDPHSYYAGADIFLSTSRYEGFGLTLLEAAAFCPIVATNAGIAPLIIGMEKVCEVGNSGCIAESLITLLASPEKRASSRAASAEKIAILFPYTHEEYLQAYRKLLVF